MSESFAEKHIWIIGASTGIGKALAIELSAQGATLILSARSEDKLNALNTKLGERHLVYPLDASDIDKLSKTAIDLTHKIPKLDSVIFLAAIYSPHDKQPKDITFTHQMITVNLGGAFNVVNATLPIFQKQGKGQIILCGSVAGYRGLPFGQPYCATKAAIINYAESLKIELEPQNIDVKLISPGFVRTPLTDKNDFSMPMIIEPEEAAKAITKGMKAKAFEIHFPRKFTWIMKLLKILPTPLYFSIARKIRDKQ